MDGFHKNHKTALFIDGANLYHSVRGLGFEIDFRKFRDLFADEVSLMRAYYYTALPDNQTYSPIRPLMDFLAYNGFRLVTKSMREFTGSDGQNRIKGNMDIEIAVDMMQIAPHLDHIVLVSGDGDFCYLIDAVQRMGKYVTVVSTTHTKPSMLADDLRRQTDYFIDIADIQDKISRAPSPSHASQASHASHASQASQASHPNAPRAADDVPPPPPNMKPHA